MANRRTTRPPRGGQIPAGARVQDDDDDEAQALETPAAAKVSGDEVEQLIEQLGASASAARIIVHRIEANADPEECIDCPLSVFSKEQLRAQYGPGRYSCEVRNKGVIKRRWEWRFAKPLQSAAPVAQQGSSQVESLQKALTESAARSEQRSHELLVAALGRPQREEKSGLQIGDLVQFKELFGGGGGGGNTMSQFKEFLELRELLGGNDGGGASGMDLALKALEVFPDWIKAGDRSAPAPRRIAHQPGAPAAKPAAPDKKDQIIALLLKHAKDGTAPKIAAQFGYEQLQGLDDQTYEAVCNWIESDGAVSMALIFEPRLQPAQAWLQQVAGELRGLISADDDATELTSGAGGDDGGAGDSPTD